LIVVLLSFAAVGLVPDDMARVSILAADDADDCRWHDAGRPRPAAAGLAAVERAMRRVRV